MKKLLMILSVVTLFFISSQPVNSMCVYNDTEKTDGTTGRKLQVCFSCGLFCQNLWSIDPGDYRCRKGKGGTVHVFVNTTCLVPGCCLTVGLFDVPSACLSDVGDQRDVKIKVEPHGWVEITSEKVSSGQEIILCQPFS